MDLLEREQQLHALGQYADDLGRGDGRLVLVSGEAGVGKSTLRRGAASERARACVGRGARCDGAVHARGRSVRCSTSPPQLDGDLARRGRRAGRARAAVRGPSSRRWSSDPRRWCCRGRPLGRRRDARPDRASSAGGCRGAGAGRGHLPRRRARGDASAARRALGALASLRATRRIDLPPLGLAASRGWPTAVGLDARPRCTR